MARPSEFLQDVFSNSNTSIVQALMVCLALDELLTKEDRKKFTVEPYLNGREDGYTLRSVKDPTRSVSFSEFRSSDDVVVYEDFVKEYNPVGSSELSEEAWERKKFFGYWNFPPIAKYICKVIHSWSKEE